MSDSNDASALLDCRDVTVYRGRRAALQNLTLRIELGQHVAVLGPNGSGKSTLIKTITRECYSAPIRGSSLRILGRDTWNIWDLRGQLGIVENDLEARLDRRMTGREIVLSGYHSSMSLWGRKAPTPAMVRGAREALALLEVEHLAERRLEEMSSGEARRLVIGRALVHEPAALVFDEPTNSLDMRAASEFKRSLSRIARAGTSIVVVTHHFDDLIPEIDRVVLLQEGRVFRDGTPSEVLTAQNLSELFGMAVQPPVLGGADA